MRNLISARPLRIPEEIMTASSTSGPDSGAPLRVSELLGILPRVRELSPFLDLLVTRSVPDPERRWAGSGELGTVGGRIIELSGVSDAASELSTAEAHRIRAVLGTAAGVVESIARRDWEEVVRLLIDQGVADEGRGRSREAEAWYLSAHRVARDQGLVRAPRALRLAARAARSLGKIETAARRYEESWRAAVELELEEDLIVAATGRGNIDVDRGRWAGARSWYHRALERLGETGEPRRERWQLLQNLAIVERKTGDLEGARRLLERARQDGDGLGDPDAAVEVENGFGLLLLAVGDPRGAELHFAEALRSARTATARVTIGVNLGEALMEQGRSLEAGERARQAEAQALAASVTGKLPEVYRLLAKVARERAEGEAFVFLEQALDLIRERGLPSYEEALTHEAYGDLRLAEGDVSRGLPQLREAAEIFDRIGMDEAAARILQTVARHEGDVRESDERE